MGDIRKLASKLGINHDRAHEWWDSEVPDARWLAILTADPKRMSARSLEDWVRSGDVDQTADWRQSYLVKGDPEKEALRQTWMNANHPWRGRSAWSQTAARVASSPEGLDIEALLDRIDKELPVAHPLRAMDHEHGPRLHRYSPPSRTSAWNVGFHPVLLSIKRSRRKQVALPVSSQNSTRELPDPPRFLFQIILFFFIG